MSAIEVKGLTKTYRKGFSRRQVHALKGIDLNVREGETFGFLGPNGAGKTTTIRILMGLIRQGQGSAKIFGNEIPSRDARQRVGFLPEAPYFYDYLSVSELLDFTGRLFQMGATERKKRGHELIELVGLSDAGKKPIRSYSKGMMQRAGIAQALMNDPELVVFDEPMSGLDPIGRKDVRDIMLSLKEAGKTVFFSSHILSDVESVADRIAIIVQGKIRDQGTLREIVSAQVSTEIAFDVKGMEPAALERLKERAQRTRTHGSEVTVVIDKEANLDEFVQEIHSAGGALISITPIHETLEEVFVRAANSAERAP